MRYRGLLAVVLLASSVRGSDPSFSKTQSFKFNWKNSTSRSIVISVTEYPPGDDQAKSRRRFAEVRVALVYPPFKIPSEVATKVRPIPAEDIGMHFIKYKEFQFGARDQRGKILKSYPRYPHADEFAIAGKGHSSASTGTFVVELDKEQKIERISLTYRGDEATISLLEAKPLPPPVTKGFFDDILSRGDGDWPKVQFGLPAQAHHGPAPVGGPPFP